MKWQLALALVAGLCMSAQAQIIDDFDDGAAATRWTAPIVEAANGAFDGQVVYDFDYSSLGIPSAPNSTGGTTTGLAMEVNVTDQDGSEFEAVGVNFLQDIMPAGDFILSVDTWFNYDIGINVGTTEHAVIGTYISGANFPADQAYNDDVFSILDTDGDGLSYTLDGDSGTGSTDWGIGSDPGNADAGVSAALGSLDSLPDGVIPGGPFITGSAVAPDGREGPATAGWVDLTVRSVAGTVTFEINGFTLPGTAFDNTGGVHSGGTIQLGYADIFSSSQATGPGFLGHYVIYDNVRFVPEPSTAIMGALALCGLALRRRV